MKWVLHANGVECTRSLREYIERRLVFALSRFDTRIGKVDVYLADHNGPKGGLDKSVRITVPIHRIGTVTAQVVDCDWMVTIDRVTTRMAQQIRRELERTRQANRSRIEDPRGLAPVDKAMLAIPDAP